MNDYQTRLAEILVRMNHRSVINESPQATIVSEAQAAINALNRKTIGEANRFKPVPSKLANPYDTREAFRTDLRRQFGVES